MSTASVSASPELNRGSPRQVKKDHASLEKDDRQSKIQQQYAEFQRLKVQGETLQTGRAEAAMQDSADLSDRPSADQTFRTAQDKTVKHNRRRKTSESGMTVFDSVPKINSQPLSDKKHYEGIA